MTVAIWIVVAIFGGIFGLIQLRFLVLIVLPHHLPPARVVDVEPTPVVVQIATFREAAAIPLLLEAVAQLDWPRDKLLVQVLDDSPPDDAARTEAVVADYAGRGLPVTWHHRRWRKGFKAGALNHGLETADAVDYIAYFDADCRPCPQFLNRVMPHFVDPKVAAVQARWRYPNARTSPLTALQAAAFEYLFAYDYPVRAMLGLPAYYLGSAAVWRRSVPIALGGWRYEPFTAEDVDMGLRAGIAGWKVVYEPEVLADDDAVEEILAFRAQQRRWAQAVLRAGLAAAPHLPRPFGRPWAMLMDWTSFAPHALIPLTPLLTTCLAFWVLLAPPAPTLFWTFSALMAVSPATVALALAQRRFHPRDWLASVGLLIRAGPYAAATMTSFLFGFGDFLRSKRLEFVATPKAGQSGVIGGRRKKWLKAQIGPLALDFCFALLFCGTSVYAVRDGLLCALLPLLLMSIVFLASALLTGAALLTRAQPETSAECPAP